MHFLLCRDTVPTPPTRPETAPLKWEEATAAFVEVSLAHEVLVDDDRRAHYDATGKAATEDEANAAMVSSTESLREEGRSPKCAQDWCFHAQALA